MFKNFRLTNWLKASPWLLGTNPRDMILPIDGDDGFYPTGNELVLDFSITLTALYDFNF